MDHPVAFRITIHVLFISLDGDSPYLLQEKGFRVAGISHGHYPLILIHARLLALFPALLLCPGGYHRVDMGKIILKAIGNYAAAGYSHIFYPGTIGRDRAACKSTGDQ